MLGAARGVEPTFLGHSHSLLELLVIRALV